MNPVYIRSDEWITGMILEGEVTNIYRVWCNPTYAWKCYWKSFSKNPLNTVAECSECFQVIQIETILDGFLILRT
jgi:hypothetical protein